MAPPAFRPSPAAFGSHVASSSPALCTLLLLWLATVASELWGRAELVVAVKTGILGGLAVLIPSLVTAGASGRTLARGRAGPKTRRLRWAALTGVTVLIPCPVLLYDWARAGQFGARSSSCRRSSWSPGPRTSGCSR